MADGEEINEGRTPLKDYTNVLTLNKPSPKKLNLSGSGGGEAIIKEPEIEVGEDTNQYSDNYSDQPSNYSVPTSPSKNNTDADTTDYESADEGTFPQKTSKTPSKINAEPEVLDKSSFDSSLTKAFENLKVDTEPKVVQRRSLEFNTPTKVRESEVLENTPNFAGLKKAGIEIQEQPSFKNLFEEKTNSPVKEIVAEASNPVDTKVQKRSIETDSAAAVDTVDPNFAEKSKNCAEIEKQLSLNKLVEEPESPAKVNEIAEASSPAKVDEIAEASSPAKVKEIVVASSPAIVNEIAQASSPAKVNEIAQASSPAKVNEISEASSPAKVKEISEASSPAKVNEISEASSPAKVKEISEASSPAKVNEIAQASSPAKVNEIAEASSPAKVNEIAEASSPAKVNEISEASSPAKVKEKSEASSPAKVNEIAQASSPAKVNEIAEASSPAEVNEKPIGIDNTVDPNSVSELQPAEVAEFKILEKSFSQNTCLEENNKEEPKIPAELDAQFEVLELSSNETSVAKESQSPVKVVSQSFIDTTQIAESPEPNAVDLNLTIIQSESPVVETKNLVENSKSSAKLIDEPEALNQSTGDSLTTEVPNSPEAVDEPEVKENFDQSSVESKHFAEVDELQLALEESIDSSLIAETPKFEVVENTLNLVAEETKISEVEQPSTQNLITEESKVIADVTQDQQSIDSNLPAETSESREVEEEVVGNIVDTNFVTEETKNSAETEQPSTKNLITEESKVNTEPIALDETLNGSNLTAETPKSPDKVEAVTNLVQRHSIESKSPAKLEESNVENTIDLILEETKNSVKVDAEVAEASIDSNSTVENSKSKVDKPEKATDQNLVSGESNISPKVDAETIDAKLKYLLTNLLDKTSTEDNPENSIIKSETDPEESIFISGSNCKKVNIQRSRHDLSCIESPIHLNNTVGSQHLDRSNASINSDYEYSYNFAPCNVSSPEEIIFKKPFDKNNEKLSLKQALIDQEIAQRLNVTITCTNRDLSSIKEETNNTKPQSTTIEDSIESDVLKSIASADSSFIREDSLEPNSSRKSSIREDSLEPNQSIFSKTINTMDKSFNGLQELYETCSKQERELGYTDVAEPVLFNLSFAAEAKKLAEDISKMDINGEDLNDIKPPQYMMQSSLPPEINNSEAGPVTADEDFNKSDYFQEGSFDFEYLSKFENKSKRTALSRDSLFLKFDPLVGELVPGDLNESNMSERGTDTTVIENNRTPSRNDTAPLLDITPLGRRSVNSTPSGTKPQGNTPTLKQEVLSKEISKLQHLMVQQEAAHQELLLEKTDEVENLRKRVAELETKAPQRDIEERVKFLESENAKLHKELKESQASNKQLTAVMAEYEKTISQLVTNKEETVSQYEKIKDEIAQERDTAISHLNNMEVAFNDVHVKYEKVKSIVEIQHGNEKLLKDSLEAHTKTIEQQKSNYEKLKRHASEKLDGANREIVALKSSHQMEMAKMNAVAKKSDLKIKSLEESLEQKQKEIRELTQICDELIEQQDKIFGEEKVEENKENLNLTFQLPSLRQQKKQNAFKENII